MRQKALIQQLEFSFQLRHVLCLLCLNSFNKTKLLLLFHLSRKIFVMIQCICGANGHTHRKKNSNSLVQWCCTDNLFSILDSTGFTQQWQCTIYWENQTFHYGGKLVIQIQLNLYFLHVDEHWGILEPLSYLLIASHNDVSVAHYTCFSNLYQ